MSQASGESAPRDHARVKRAVVRACRRLYDRHLVAGRQGNVSARAEDGTIWLTPAGMCKGDVSEADLVRLDLDGHVLEGTRPPTSERTTHLETYRRRDDVHAVVHAHPPFCTAFAAAQVPLPSDVLPEVVLTIGTVPLVPYGTPSSAGLTGAIAPYLAEHACFLLANHGALALGDSVEDAFDRLEQLESYAAVVWRAGALGGVKALEDGQLRELERMIAR